MLFLCVLIVFVFLRKILQTGSVGFIDLPKSLHKMVEEIRNSSEKGHETQNGNEAFYGYLIV